MTRTLMAVGGLTAALAVAACGMDQDSGAGAPEGAAMTLNGCLQETSGDFILTMHSAAGTSGAVGTAGNPGSTSPAEEHLQSAADAYRLEGDEDRLRSHVGQQVRVMGTVDDATDVAPRANTGSGESDRTDIDAGDLALLEVSSIEQVAETCGAGGTSAPAAH